MRWGLGMMQMYPRKRFDISWSDFLYAAFQCCIPGASARETADIEHAWGERSLVCFSVRSGLDLFLQATNWPRGSEVLVSGMTIPEMPLLLELHGLKVVPIDIDCDTLEPNLEQMVRAITPRTKAFLYAHLFGARARLDNAVTLAHRYGIEVLEDQAQSFCGRPGPAEVAVDAVFFSFGPIKTATALGGGIVLIKNSERLARMRRIQARYRCQPRWAYFRRVLRFWGLHCLSHPRAYGLFISASNAVGLDYDRYVRRAVKNFPVLDLRRLRQRPSAPLVRLLRRRLSRFSHAEVSTRRRCGLEWLAQLGDNHYRPACRAWSQGFWVFPLLVENPEETVRSLRLEGFDASRITSNLTLVAPTEGCRSEGTPALARMAQKLVIVPFDPAMPRKDQRRLVVRLRESVTVQ